MSAQMQGSANEAGSVVFELDRFEPVGDDRIEVLGRWFGVRGRRFVRPTLTLVTDGGKRRALAELEHKPWAAEDGEPWLAAFRWEQDGANLVDVELAVAPDIAIMLPVTGDKAGRGSARSTRSPVVRERQLRSELRGARDVVDRKRAEVQRLRDELERALAEKLEAASARAGAETKLRRLQAKLDEVATAGEGAASERDQAVAARVQALKVRDEALTARDEAVRARDQALAIREETIATRDEAIAARDSLTRAYARLRSELAQATSQLDLAISQLDEATYERDQAHAELVELRAQVEAGSGLQAPRPPAVSEVPLPSIIASSPSRRRQVDWVGRALAITLLLAALIVIVSVLHVL